MIKLLTVIGARPQLIKAAAISREIERSFKDTMSEVIVHTGQHYDENMSGVFFEELNIPREKYNLQVGSGSHAFQTAQMMLKLDTILQEEQPDYLLLYGDTNSTIAAALTAIKLFIPIIHVEAGVRGYNKAFPEEVNRLLTDHISTLLFTPTQSGYDCLMQEGFRAPTEEQRNSNRPGVYLCGDIMFDNTLFFQKALDQQAILDKYNLQPGFVLLTMHRPSNVDDQETLSRLLETVVDLQKTHNVSFAFPVHPRTVASIRNLPNRALVDAFMDNPNIHILPPVSFLEMIALESASCLVMTDSGGVQKEAYFLQRPCLIMLFETPWVELIDSGCAHLVGNDSKKIRESFAHFMQQTNLKYPPIYGDGNAANFILKTIAANGKVK